MFFIGSIFLTNLYILLYGKIFNKFYFKNSNNSIYEIAILGSIFVAFLGLLINFLFPLNKIINSIIFLIPFFLLLKKKNLNKNDFFFLILSTIFVYFIIIFSTINRPDAGLYHLPFTQILNEHKIILGLSNIHSRFGHISIIQYLSAINYNFIIGLDGILIPLASLMVFIFLYFVSEIYKFINNNYNFDLNYFFCLLVVMFICYKINRFSGFGNDATSHLLFFYLISLFLKSQNTFEDLSKMTLIATYIFLSKITLILSFAFPIISYLFFKNRNNKIFYSFSVFFLFLWFLKNILISSCLIFPIKATCLKNLEWNNNSQIVEQSILGEAWSKGWPDRSNQIITQEDFIKEFNWVKAWYSKHFKLISKIFIPYLFLIVLILILINFTKKDDFRIHYIKKKDKTRILFSLAVSLLGTLIFFLKFPLYRYGYSYLVSSFCMVTCLGIFRYDYVIVKKIFKLILIICISIFYLKQILRITEYHSSRQLIPNIYSFDNKKEKKINKFKLIGENYKIYISVKECMYSQSPCTNNLEKNISHKKILNYNMIYIKS